MAFCFYHGDALSGENRACPKCAEEFQMDGYDVIRAISKNDWGVEYLGFEPQYYRPVVIKSITQDMCPPQDKWEEFEKNALIQGKLQHPSIVRIYHYIYLHRRCYVIMEYTEGKSGADIIQKTGPVPASKALLLCIQVAKAIEYAHSQKIYHGLLDATLMSVSDVGAVKIRGFDYLRLKRYVDEQQVKLPEELTDIALFGKLLYEFLTGCRISLSELPSKPMTDYYPYIPSELRDFTLKVIKPKESGLNSMAEIHQELKEIAQKVT